MDDWRQGHHIFPPVTYITLFVKDLLSDNPQDSRLSIPSVISSYCFSVLFCKNTDPLQICLICFLHVWLMSYYCIFQLCITDCAASISSISMKKFRYFTLDVIVKKFVSINSITLSHREEGPECAPYFPSLYLVSKHSNKQTQTPSVKLTPCSCPGYLATVCTPFSSLLPRTSWVQTLWLLTWVVVKRKRQCDEF